MAPSWPPIRLGHLYVLATDPSWPLICLGHLFVLRHGSNGWPSNHVITNSSSGKREGRSVQEDGGGRWKEERGREGDVEKDGGE